MVTRRWDTALDANTMTSYTDAAALMEQQCILNIVSWEAAAKMLDQWLVVVIVLLGPQEYHPAVFELATLLTSADEVNSRLQAQAAVQQDIPAALVRLIQTEFNESFLQAFTSHLPVRWPRFIHLIRTLTTRHFNPGTVTMPVEFQQSLPTIVTPHRSTGPPHKTSTKYHLDEGKPTPPHHKWQYKIPRHFYISKLDQYSDSASPWNKRQRHQAFQCHKQTTAVLDF